MFASMLWRCLLTAAGCWIVAAIADGVRMDGSVGGQVLASLLVGVTFQLPAVLQKLLERAANLTITEDETATLASRLAALEHQLTPEERAELDSVAGGSVREVVRHLVDAVDPDRQAEAIEGS